MTIAVLKSFYDGVAGTTDTPAGFTLDGDNYIRAFAVDRASLELVDESDATQVDAAQCVDGSGVTQCATDEICMRDSGSSTYSCQEMVYKKVHSRVTVTIVTIDYRKTYSYNKLQIYIC